MSFLPVVERELRVSARNTGTHRLWFCSALAMVGLLILVVVGDRGTQPQQLGSVLLAFAGSLAFVYTLLAGVFLTSDCLCSERRDGTLGLLFLTDLRGYDVVLGKLAATSTVSVYALLGTVPALGLPLLLGGVSGAEFARLILVLFTALFLSLSLGLFASAVCEDTRAAMLLSFGVLLALTGGLYLLTALADSLMHSVRAAWILLPSPLLAMMRWSDTAQLGPGASQYWWSIGVVTAISLGLLARACQLLPRAWREGAEGRARGARGMGAAREAAAVPDAGPGPVTRPVRPRREALSANPFGWLTGRETFPGPKLTALLGTVLGIWCICAAYVCLVGSASNAGGEMSFMTATFTAYGLHVVVKGLVAVQATRRLGEDRRSGALELLLTTPLDPAAMVTGQWRTLRRQFGWIVGASTAVNLVMAGLAALVRPAGMPGEVAGIFCAMFLGGIVLLWVDVHALAWFGMWSAMRGARPHRAALNTLVRVLVPPWLAIAFFLVLGRGGLTFGEVVGCWLAWLILSTVSALVALARSRRRLVGQFRRLAAGEVSPVSPGQG